LLVDYFGTVKTGVPPVARVIVEATPKVMTEDHATEVTYAQLEAHANTHADTWRQRFSRIAPAAVRKVVTRAGVGGN
jgi:hypothetical protein